METELKKSKRCDLLLQSDIRNMSIECDKVRGINLSQGICDMALPPPLISHVGEAVKNGINHYTRYDGLAELREAISLKSMKYNGIDTDPERNIIVSCGATGAFYCACLALLNPGDEVVLFEPFYGYHVNTLLAVEANIKYVKLNPPDWSFNIDDLEQAITLRTKAIMINTPANPCGKVFTGKELEVLADFCVHHDLLVFTDEIYEYIVYDGRQHMSPAYLPNLRGRTVTISGYSKTFSITGWRIGYCLCNENIAQMIGYMNDLIYVCAPAPLQSSVAHAIRSLPDSFYEEMRSSYTKKRNMVCSTLSAAGLEPFVPQGAYYVLANADRLPGSSSRDKALNLLASTGVASVPGRAFYHDGGGDNIIRFCFAKSDDDLSEACERLLKLKR